MADERVNFVISAQDRATATLTRLKGELGLMGGAAAKTAGPLGRLSSVTGGLVSPMGLAVGGAIGLGAAFLSTAQGASDLNEEMSKSAVVFGPASDEMVEFAEGASRIGLSTRAALSAAGAFGNMFNTVGLTQGVSQDMSETMVQLAADMASFNNMDPTQMLDKLRAGLSGEAEPLRQVGVLLSETAVKQYAWRTGIAATGTALTEAQKVTARYGLILEQTADQQGDATRTADQLAGSQRRWSAQLENASNEVGKSSASIILGFMKVVEFLNTPINPFSTMERDAQLAAAGMANTVPPAIAAMQEELRKGGPVIATEAGHIAGMLPSEIQRRVGEIRQAGRDSVIAFATGVLEARMSPLTEAQALVTAMNTTLSQTEVAAALTGSRMTGAIARAMASGDPALQFAARSLVSNTTATINGMGPAGAAAGSAFVRNLAWAINQHGTAVDAARRAAGNIRAVFPFSEPKDPKSPFRGIGTWGANIMDAIAGGIDGRGVAAAVRNSMGGMLPAFGGAMAPAYAGGGGYAAPAAPLQIQLVVDSRVLAEVVTREQYYQSPAGPSVLPRGT